MPADTTIDTPEIIVRALTGSSTPTSSGPVVSVLTHPGYDLAADYVEPAGGDWVSEFPIRVRSDGKGVVNWTHAIPVGLGAVEHKAIAGDTGELILATGLTDFFQSVGDLNGIDLTEYESPSSRTPIGRYTADECLRAAADAEALVRGGYATGVSIEFRPNGPKGSVEGEGAYWDREVKSPMLPRPGRHFKSWTGLAYAHARRPVNPGCHTVVNDIDVELVAKAIRVMETGKVGGHVLCDRVLKSFREDAPDLLALARAARRSTVAVEGTPPTDNKSGYTLRELKAMSDGEAIARAANDPKHRDLTPQSVYADWLEDHEPHHATPEVLAALRGNTPVWVSRHPETGAVVTRPKVQHTLADLQAAHRAAGGHYWDRDTMRFFGSRNCGDPHCGPGGTFFVNSTDNYDRTARQYRVVEFNHDTAMTRSTDHPDGSIDPFDNLAEAKTHAKRLAAGEAKPREGKAVPDDTAVEVKAKSDAWIAWKVRKLVGEGKPRKQAVAVAYSMAGRDKKETKAYKPDGSELVTLIRKTWWHENGSASTRATRESMICGSMENHGTSRAETEEAFDRAHKYAAADWKRFKETSGEFCPECDARLERDDDKCNSCGYEYKASPEINTTPPTRTEFYAKVRKAWGGHPGSGASFTGSYLRMRAGLSDGDIAHAKKQGWLVKSQDGEGHELHPSFNTRVAPWEPITAKSYTGPLRASGKLNTNPNVEDEERGDDEPDFEIPGLDDDSDRDTKAVRTPRYDPTASQYAQTAHRLTGEALNLSRDVAPGMHKVATAALEASRLRDSATAITHLTKLADWHGKQARTAPPDTADLHAEAGMTARRALALHKMVADRGGVSGGAMQYTPGRTRPTKLKPSGFTPLPEFADRAATAHEVSRQVTGSDTHDATRYAAMAAREAAKGNYEKAGGAHLGAIREHEKELRKAGLSDYTRSRHEAAIQDHRLAAKKLHDHLLSQGWVSPRRQREVAATTPAPSTVRRPLYSGLEGSPYRPAVKPSAIDTATYEASKRQLTGPVEPAAAKRGIVGGLLKRLGITKAFEDDVSDPYEVARIASGLAMKTGNDREAKATIARKSPAEMKAYHERAADNPRLDADAADRHLRAAEMWERAMVPSPVRLGNGRPYMKARTDGFDVPAVALGPDERPPASISALMNFAQLQMDGAEALAYDAQQSDDLMFRTYAKALATQAQTAAATLQKQASAMQQYLNGAANNGGMQKHPLMGVLSTDQNQPGTTTSGDVPPGADGTTADDADDVTANGAQKAFTDDAALDSLFGEPVAVPAGPEVDDDGWLVFKAFPEWKPRRYAMSELRDLPRANTGHASKSAAANTATAVQTPVISTVEAKADEWANPEVAAKLSELTAQLKKLKQLDEAVQHRQQRGGW